jgi:hypothetical protein
LRRKLAGKTPEELNEFGVAGPADCEIPRSARPVDPSPKQIARRDPSHYKKLEVARLLAQGMSQKDIVAAVGVGQTTVKRWEKEPEVQAMALRWQQDAQQREAEARAFLDFVAPECMKEEHAIAFDHKMPPNVRVNALQDLMDRQGSFPRAVQHSGGGTTINLTEQQIINLSATIVESVSNEEVVDITPK